MNTIRADVARFVFSLISYDRIGFFQAMHANAKAGPARDVCHMHDFTDANMHAMRAVGGEDAFADFDALCDAINDMWNAAKAGGYLSEMPAALWAVVRATADASGYEWSEDDDGMRDADPAMLAGWADDVRARLGDAATADAVEAYARHAADVLAVSVLFDAFGFDVDVDHADPRGANLGGALTRWDCSVGLYLGEDNTWIVSDGRGEETPIEGDELDRVAAVTALRAHYAACIAAGELS